MISIRLSVVRDAVHHCVVDFEGLADWMMCIHTVDVEQDVLVGENR